MRAKILLSFLLILFIVGACQKQVGPAGATGPQGPSALPCTVTQTLSGATITCPDGTTANLADGQTGAAGAQGQAGASCSVSSTQSGATITCPNGTSASVTNGLNGLPGTNGTTITPVQFCESCHPTYPSVFSESGLCIGGNLFAVYSANDGFLAYVPPGAYQSDGINCSCTFTVGTNCAISQ